MLARPSAVAGRGANVVARHGRGVRRQLAQSQRTQGRPPARGGGHAVAHHSPRPQLDRTPHRPGGVITDRPRPAAGRGRPTADVAQRSERRLATAEATGSNPVIRSAQQHLKVSADVAAAAALNGVRVTRTPGGSDPSTSADGRGEGKPSWRGSRFESGQGTGHRPSRVRFPHLPLHTPPGSSVSGHRSRSRATRRVRFHRAHFTGRSINLLAAGVVRIGGTPNFFDPAFS